MLEVSKNNVLRFFLRLFIPCIFTIAFLLFNGASLTGVQQPLRRSQTPVSATVKFDFPVYIAANYYNNEPILPSHLHQLQLFLETYCNLTTVAISIYENGSNDRTKEMLSGFKGWLSSRNIHHSVVTEGSPAWTYTIPNTTKKGNSRQRISHMAEVRNRALDPLRNVTFASAHRARLIFINDVVFSSSALARLLKDTDHVDVACATDFSSFTFYDLWVARDWNGQRLSAFAPYSALRDPATGWIPAFSCWNGAAAFGMPPSELPEFRVWRNGEVRDPRHMSPAQVFDDDRCTVSECALLFHDLWARRKSLRVVVDTRVKVAYSLTVYRFVVMFVLRFVDAFTLLFLRLDGGDRGLEEWVGAEEVGAPQSIDCGIRRPRETVHWRVGRVWALAAGVAVLACVAVAVRARRMGSGLTPFQSPFRVSSVPLTPLKWL